MQIADIYIHQLSFSPRVIIPKSMTKETEENMSKPWFIHLGIRLLIGYLLNIEFIKSMCFIQIVGKIV